MKILIIIKLILIKHFDKLHYFFYLNIKNIKESTNVL